jgi:hypothetical protein
MPDTIQTNLKLASMRQLHVAIDSYEKQNFECAITLAAAAEGILMPTNEPHFHQKVRDLEKKLEGLEGSAGANDVVNWLKHGTFKGRKCENATISDLEVVVAIWRALTKFEAIYGEWSPQMKSFVAALQKKVGK